MALIRPLTTADHAQVLPLYAVLGGSCTEPETFETILCHPGTTIWGGFDDDTLKAMTTLHILPNLTQNGRPYALIENVASLPSARGQGHARAVMQAASDTAWAADAYKIMLLTGQDTGAKGFYESLGFRADQKFGMQLRRVPARKP